MRPQDWKIFNKKGSRVDLFYDAYLDLKFFSDSISGIGAKGFAITDPSGYVSEAFIENSGWGYDPATTKVFMGYTFGDYQQFLTSAEASINLIDVSVFNPLPSVSYGIGSVYPIDVSTEFIYPGFRFSGAIFLDTVSVKLIETEHLIIMQDTSSGYVTPYDEDYPILIFRFTKGDDEIKFFEVDQDNQIINWSDQVISDASIFQKNSNPIVLNIGFRSEEEGVYERKLEVFHKINENEYQIGEIIVNAQSIGQDERFNTLSQNFGLPEAQNIANVFKESDIREPYPDWKLLNYKGKHMILEHDKIMPYIGTYKGLINAIKWLGYEDIKIKEWFKDVKDNKKLALYVPYEAPDRTKTILYFSPEERKNLKKLNQLSLIYCITKETGEYDEWGNPEVEECYDYNIDEILIKLKALKDWLEKNIIGVNARITDVTGEGIYFERFRNIIYSTQDIGSRADYSLSLTPIGINEPSELVEGDASISLSLLELSQTSVEDFYGIRIDNLVSYYWDPSNGAFSPEDSSSLWWDPSTIFVGMTFRFPIYNLSDIQWKASVEKTVSGVLTQEFVSNPLWVYDNDLRFYNILDSSSIFFDSSTDLTILLERGWIRDPSNDIWEDSISYSFYPDPSDDSQYIMESSTGIKWFTDGWIIMNPSTGSLLQYAFDDNYSVPLLKFENFYFMDSSLNSVSLLDKPYILDIADGKIRTSKFEREPSSLFADPSIFRKEDYYINWNYDTSIDEQKITLNVVYTSPRGPLYLYNPSIYYFIGESSALIADNSIYTFPVNHIGDYKIEVFGFDGQNLTYRNVKDEDYNVWTKYPIIWSYIDVSIYPFVNSGLVSAGILSLNDVSILIANNPTPIFDRHVSLEGLTLEQDLEGKYFIKIPSISYFLDIPRPNSLARFYNITERITQRSGNVFTVDPDYEWFNSGDNVNLILFNKEKYYLIEEVSGNISSKSGNDLTISGIPSNFAPDYSTGLYILNDTWREIYSYENDGKNSWIDVSTGDSNSYFRINQLLGVIIQDTCTGYSWGSSFRVLDVSLSSDPSVLGILHQVQGNIPDFISTDPSRFSLSVKNSWSSYTDINITIQSAQEINNNFNIYLEDKYYEKYYLDNTFLYVNLLFDQERVLEDWFDASTDTALIDGSFYPYTKALTVDISTLVILDTYYDPSTYLLSQQNIWTITNHYTNEILLRVFNKQVPYIFQDPGTYDVLVEAYDYFGNLRSKFFPGLITVRNEI